MVELEVRLPSGADFVRTVDAVEACAARLRLLTRMKGTLAGFPGCVHWHFKRGRERGTLEVTWWPRERRLWLSVQAGRTAGWIEATAADLRAALEDPAVWR